MTTLVTGAGKGLGAEICRRLASEGHSLVVHYHTSRSDAEKVAQQCRELGAQAETIQGDFSSPDGVEHFLRRYQAQFPATKFLVNNASLFFAKNALTTSQEEWQQLFQVNLFAASILQKALVESLKSHQGAIVNMGMAGCHSLYPDTFSPAYTATKLSLYLLTKSLARELAPFQISVNMVSPGYLENSVTLPSELPMKRPATLTEAAELVAFLLKPESRYITGQNIEIAGAVRL